MSKCSVNYRSIRSFLQVVMTLLLISAFLFQNVAGESYMSMMMEHNVLVNSPPVILQNGTAGISTIFTNSTSAKVRVPSSPYDFVDNNISNVDSSTDKGTHSNFTAQQTGPDSTYDMLTEGNTAGGITKVGTDTSGTGNNLTLSFSHTLISATNRIIIVYIGVENGNTTDVSTVTYGGVTMTLAVERITGTSGFRYLTEIWYILENDLPSDGSQTVEISCSGIPYELEVNGFCSEYTGVTQGPPEAIDGTSQLSGNTISNTISPSDDAWVLSIAGSGNPGSFTHGQGQTEVLDFQDASSTFAVAELRGASGETSLSSTYSSTVNRLCRVAASWTEANNYELDHEVQWASADYVQINKELCIKTGTFSGSEDIQVKIWNITGSSWHWVMNLTESQWNNVSITSYLTSSTFTIQFLGGTETSDTIQDSWNIDATLLHLWSSESMYDYVDNNTSDVGFPTDIGTHSNFTAQQSGPDLINDTLTEEGGGMVWLWQEDTSGYTAASSYETFEFWNSWTTNATTSGTVTKLGIYVFANPGNSPQVKLGIYDDNGGSPNNLLGETNAAIITSAGWLDLDIVGGGVSISASTTYHIAHITDIAPTTQWRYYKTATPVSDYRNNRVGLNLFDPAGATTKSSSYRYGAYRVGYDESYRLDLEAQWTSVDCNEGETDLCIYGGSMPSEDLLVDVWNGTGWQNVLTDLTANSWNNISVSSYLNSSTFTIRFKDSNEISDTIQDSWNIDTTLLHVWTSESTYNNVDNNTSDIDASVDKGTHSNFTAAQYGPDSVYDTLMEENIGVIINYENSAESYSATGQNSHNFDYSLQKGSGNNRLVVVTVSWEDDLASAIISSLTFNGTAMTKVTDVTVGTGYSEYISLWYLLDSSLPSSSGSYNIAVIVNDTIVREIYMAAAEYSGVKQSAPDDYDTHANTVGGNTAVTLTAATDGSIVIAGVGEGEINALTNTNNINNLQEQVLTSSGSALGHHTDVDSGDITVGWNNLGTREGMAGAVWQPASNYELDVEVQWVDADYVQINEELCIKTGTTDAENIRVDVWNGTEWINLLSDLTPNSWNNISVTAYLNSLTFTIRFKGGNEASDSNQDSWNIDTTLLHVWTNKGAYNYVLRVNNTASDYWEVRLKKCSDSNVGRLQNCTIYFHNSTDGTSDQIKIENGAYITGGDVGSWYDLHDSQTIYIAMIVVANGTGTSFIDIYLEIRIPDTTTYVQYVITFEIT